MCPKSAASGIRTSIVHEDHLLTLKRTKEYAGFTVALNSSTLCYPPNGRKDNTPRSGVASVRTSDGSIEVVQAGNPTKC